MSPVRLLRHRHALEMAVAFERDDLRMRMQRDGWVLLDASHEIARHRFGEPLRAHQHVHAPGGLGEVHGRLARRVAAADHDDFFVDAELRFHEGGPVIHAEAFEARQLGEQGFAVFGAGRDDDRARPQRGPRVHVHAVRRFRAVQSHGARRDQHLRAELLRLRERPSRERLARDAGRKAQVVLDLGTRGGLPARRLGLDDEHVQPFRGGVDRRREPRRTAADDDHVMHVRRRRRSR